MQTRIAFNGGEQAQQAGARYDMDAYLRGCRTLENWDVSCLGGIKRRKGMRQFADMEQGSESVAGERQAKLFPFIYSYAETSSERYLVSIAPARVRVFDRDGNQQADFISYYYYTENPDEHDTNGDWCFDADSLNVQQLNSLLIITSASSPPMQLKKDSDGNWTLQEYELKNRPWRYEKEKRDESLVVTAQVDDDSLEVAYDVDFSAVTDETESTIDGTDKLRLTYWVDQQEATALSAVARQDVTVLSSSMLQQSFAKGDKLCVPSETSVTYWVCTQEWPSTVYKEGLEYPSNYPDNFDKAVDISSYSSVSVYWSVSSVKGCYAGTKFGIRSGYWNYYTCIKDFTYDASDPNSTEIDDLTDYFRPGICLGDALPCQGEWEFWCSGTWFGEYAVIRNYESKSIYDSGWETAGRSRSYIESASNEKVTGDESGEACYLRLMLLSSRRVSSSSITSGFPPDSCGNRLIVKGFQHSQTLTANVTTDSEGNVTSVSWTCPDLIQVDWKGSKTIDTWSWQAFSDRYGYPRLCAIYGQRLVFAATEAQPQTIWLSQTDDFNNFLIYDGDDSGMAMTLATTTQNPICWILEREKIMMLGTSDKEYIVSPPSGQNVTASNLSKSMHGNTGSANVKALQADNKVLFIERGGGRCYEYGYNNETDSYQAKDISILAPCVLADHGGVVDGGFVEKPERQAVFTLADGQVALCAYQTLHNVNAWHRWSTNGTILSACAIPDGSNSDRLFFLVERSSKNSDGQDGWEDETVLNIEVVDDDSPYEDNFLNDYTSTMLTNSMINPTQSPVNKSLRQAIAFHFISDVPLKNMTFTGDGEHWSRAPLQADVLPAGWHKLAAWNSWDYDIMIGVKVWGNNECELLCLQG